jgi:hypothetical protein
MIEPAVRTFETPDVPGVAAVTIHRHEDEDGPPFRATQYHHRDTFEDGTEWLDERDDYVTTETYRRAVAEHTHIPLADIRLDALPVAEPEVF